MRILHIMGGATAGGIAAVVYNYMLNIDQKEFHFDFALTGDEPGMLGIQMIEHGANYYKLPMKSKNLREYQTQVRELLTKESFDVIHVHSGSTAYVTLRIAKQLGIKCRIAHAHSTGLNHGFPYFLRIVSGRILNYYYATTLIACGKKVGDVIFGKGQMRSKKGTVLPNAVDVERFRFNREVREIVRDKLELENKYVIGMIGRLSTEKNQIFAMKVIHALHKRIKNIMFIIVGEGDNQDEIERFCIDKNMTGYVRLLGIRQDIENIYQCLDICIMPSLYEGFPVTGVEAMTAGLPILLSDTITSELAFGRFVKYLPLNIDIWVNELSRMPINMYREEGYFNVRMHGFGIKDVSHKLTDIYINDLKQN